MFCRDEFLNLSMSAHELNKFLNNRCWSEISKESFTYLTNIIKTNVIPNIFKLINLC